jgi:hypothetical protein
VIPIAHEPDHRTDLIGRYSGGQFYANAWDHHAYVHLFDRDGTYRESTIVRVADRDQLDQALDDLVSALPGKVYGDIAVKLFRTEADGVMFGLIDESGDREGDGGHVDWVELHPDGLGFCEPWDGDYST